MMIHAVIRTTLIPTPVKYMYMYIHVFSINLLRDKRASVAEWLRSFATNHKLVIAADLHFVRDIGVLHVRKLSSKITERRCFYSGAM
jgi:hypothetical protein